MRFSKSVTNMALKHVPPLRIIYADFGTIRNNTALKQKRSIYSPSTGFGTIRNNTALKLDCTNH